VQLLLGHTKLESTVRYLGIEVDDALELAEQTGSKVVRGRRLAPPVHEGLAQNLGRLSSTAPPRSAEYPLLVY